MPENGTGGMDAGKDRHTERVRLIFGRIVKTIDRSGMDEQLAHDLTLHLGSSLMSASGDKNLLMRVLYDEAACFIW